MKASWHFSVRTSYECSAHLSPRPFAGAARKISNELETRHTPRAEDVCACTGNISMTFPFVERRKTPATTSLKAFSRRDVHPSESDSPGDDPRRSFSHKRASLFLFPPFLLAHERSVGRNGLVDRPFRYQRGRALR